MLLSQIIKDERDGTMLLKEGVKVVRESMCYNGITLLSLKTTQQMGC